MIIDPGVTGLTIRSLLGFHAARTPGAVALLAPERPPMSYAQLLAQVQQTRTTLQTAGVSRSDRVAVVLSNGPEMAAVFLAIADAAICAPLNPAYRESEFGFYLSDLTPKAMLIEAGVESPALGRSKRPGHSQ